MIKRLGLLLALYCAVSTVASAQGMPRAATSTRVTWEYAQLIYAPKPVGPIWMSADTDSSMSAKLSAAENEPHHPGTAPLIQVLNVIGAQGWELVSAPQGASVAYTFKRRIEK